MATSRNKRFMSSRFRDVLCLPLFVAAGVVPLMAIGSSLATGQRVGGRPVNVANKIAPWVVAQTATGQRAEFMVVLADQAGLHPASALATKSEKGRFVRDALWEKSQATQGPIL